MDVGIGAKTGTDPQKLRLPIAAVLVVGFGGLVLLAVASVLALGLASATRNTFDLLRDKATLRLDVLETHVKSHLDPVHNLAVYLGRMLGDGALDPTDQTRLTATLRGALAAVPQVMGIGYSDPEGNLTVVTRWSGSVEVLHRSRKPGAANGPSLPAVAGGQVVGPFWSDPRWNPELQETFLTVNVPIQHDGQLVGGLFVGVTLSDLTRFVTGLGDEPAGAAAFILFGRRHVLAHPAMAGRSWLPSPDDGIPLPRRAALDDPVLELIQDAHVDRVLSDTSPPPHVVTLPEKDPEYLVMGRRLTEYGPQPWIIGQEYRIEDVGTEVRRLFHTAAVGLAILAASMVLALVVGRSLTRQIRYLGAAANSLRTLHFAEAPTVPDSRFRELAHAGRAFNDMVVALRWFEMYVPKALVLRLMRQRSAAGVTSQERLVTVMFTDIRGFSGLSQTLGPNEVATLLNDHFTLLANCIEAQDGTVDKFIGDSVMAFWGAPEEQPDQAARAIRAARAIVGAVTADNRRRQRQGQVEIRVRVAIHSGHAVVGNIGSANRINYTLVGDTVNTAARLEQLAGSMHGEEGVIVLVSGATAAAAGAGEGLTPAGEHVLRGRAGRVAVYRLQ